MRISAATLLLIRYPIEQLYIDNDRAFEHLGIPSCCRSMAFSFCVTVRTRKKDHTHIEHKTNTDGHWLLAYQCFDLEEQGKPLTLLYEISDLSETSSSCR